MRYGLLDRPVVQGLNDEKDSYTQRRFSYGNGLTNEFRLDAYGRIVSAGNVQVGQTQLNYGDAANGQGGPGNGTPSTSPHSTSEPEQVTTQRPILLGQRAQEQAARTLMSQLKGQSTQWLGSPKDESQQKDLAQSLGLPAIHHDFNDARFDALGRQTTQGIDRYSYDSLNRLTQLKRLAPQTGQEQVVASYRYNLFGQRIAKTVASTDGKTSKTTYYFYDGSQLVAETSDEGKLQNQYVWLNDKPVGLLKSGHLFAVHTDHRNAPLAVTDEARTVVWQAQVADYLRSTPVQGGERVPGGQSTSLGQIEFNLRGSNQYFDAESGLHYNTHRYYDPVAARYLSPDAMGLAVGPDLYAFALNRPHSMSDPLGLQPVSNKDWSKSSYEDKLFEIITRAAPLVPGEIGAALQEMVKPANLAIMGAVFAGFIAIQATPIGWIADAALLGYGAWMIGSGITELLHTLINLHNDTRNAKCEIDLNAAASRLAKGFVSSTGEVVGGLAGVWGAKSSGGLTRISNGIKTLLEYGKKNFGPNVPLVVVEGNVGASVGAGALTKGLGGTIKIADMPGFKWVAGISKNFKKFQGDPWEAMVQSKVSGAIKLGNNFKAFDHVVGLPGGKYRAISSKTLDTLTDAKLKSPNAIGSTIKGYVQDTLKFTADTKDGFSLTAPQIASREIQLAISAGTNAAQWAAINQAVIDAAAQGVKIVISVVAP